MRVNLRKNINWMLIRFRRFRSGSNRVPIITFFVLEMGRVDQKKGQVKKEEDSASEEDQGPYNRDQLIEILRASGHRNPERYTKPELQVLVEDLLHGETTKDKDCRDDPMKGISRYPKRDLVEVALAMGVSPAEVSKMTNPRLTLAIRGVVEAIVDTKLGFGKHKDRTFREVVQIKGYMDWAMKEDLEHAHPRFRQMVTLYKMFYKMYPTPNPEVKEPEKPKQGATWPKEPEEESSIPTGKEPETQKGRNPKMYKIHSEIEAEDDSGEISDSPPAWQEKKSKGGSTASTEVPKPWPRPANPQQKRK